MLPEGIPGFQISKSPPSISPGDTTRVVSGSADQTLRIWDCETGKCLHVVPTPTSVRSAAFSYSGKWVLYTTDSMMKRQPEINVIDLATGEHLSGESALFKVQLNADQTKVLSSLWGALDESVITGHESGNVARWDLRSGSSLESGTAVEPMLENKVHKGQINDMQYNKDQTMFITASKDNTAKVIGDRAPAGETFGVLKPLSFLFLIHFSSSTPTPSST